MYIHIYILDPLLLHSGSRDNKLFEACVQTITESSLINNNNKKKATKISARLVTSVWPHHTLTHTCWNSSSGHGRRHWHSPTPPMATCQSAPGQGIHYLVSKTAVCEDVAPGQRHLSPSQEQWQVVTVVILLFKKKTFFLRHSCWWFPVLFSSPPHLVTFC